MMDALDNLDKQLEEIMSTLNDKDDELSFVEVKTLVGDLYQ